MTPAPEGPVSGPHGYYPNNRKWADANRMVMVLGAIILGVMSWWGSLVWSMARGAEQKNIEQDTMIRVLIEKSAETSVKLDRILERMPK